MTEIKLYSHNDIVPHKVAVFAIQGIPADAAVPKDTEVLYDRALGLLSELAAPFSIISEISAFDFDVVYFGEGRNESKTPIADICRRADYLALFAVTLGERICEEIQHRFDSHDLALASMLDSVASAAADTLATITDQRFFEGLTSVGYPARRKAVVGYSPGYCGWHISAQRKLFDFLRPQQIGISLNDSFLMQPLKSVSGVLAAGPKEIHSVPTSYPACSTCETRGCRERIRTLTAE